MYAIPTTDLFNASAETLDVRHNYMALGFNFIGNRLGACSALAVSPTIDLTGRPGKSFLHSVQSPFRVFAISMYFPAMLIFFLKQLRFDIDSLGPMGEGINYTKFS